jgi:hypothetical protein
MVVFDHYLYSLEEDIEPNPNLIFNYLKDGKKKLGSNQKLP